MLLRRVMLVLGLAACGRGGVVVLEGEAGGGGASTAVASSGVTSGVGGTTVTTSASTTTTGSGMGGQGGAVEICSSNSPCTGCIAAQCPEVWCDCLDDPDCLALFDCFGSCAEDETCEQQCLALHEDGISDVVQVSGCAGTVCPQACGWGNNMYDECAECVYDTCEPEMNACLANPSCSALFSCFQQCPELDLTCQQTCYDTYPQGVSDLQTALMCINAGCESECDS